MGGSSWRRRTGQPTPRSWPCSTGWAQAPSWRPGESTETDGGEGGSGEGDAAAGEAVFTANCGSCHTLEEAGTTGTVGPNLDESTLDVDAVVTQVENGGGGMPPFGGQLSEEEIANVAAFVVASQG